MCSAVLLFLAALLVPPRIARGAQERKKSARVKRVEELFNRNCARCHGADGRGDTALGTLFKAPDFTDGEWWAKKNASNRSLVSTGTRGQASMPAFGKKLKRSQINLLVGRVRSFRK